MAESYGQSKLGGMVTDYRNRSLVIILLILLLAATLRLSLLGSKSLWFDEAYSVREALLPHQKIWVREPLRTDSHPPLYYSALHYWVELAGTSETAMRAPSALFSFLNVALIYLLARRLLDKSVALLAAALLAVASIDIWYAQEARMYIFMSTILLAGATLLALDRRWSFLALAVVLVVGLYTDYTMPLLWIILSALWFAWWWREDRPLSSLLNWSAATIIAFLLFLPWQATFMEWLGRFSEVTFYLRLTELIGLPPLSAQQYLILAILAGLISAPAILSFSNALQDSRTRRWVTILYLAAFVLASTLFVVPRFYSLKRLIVQAWPLAILFAAWLIARTARSRELAASIIILSLAASLAGLLFVHKDDWRGVVSYINRHSDAGDVAILEHPWNLMVTNYYGLAPRIVTREAIADAAVGEGDLTTPVTLWYLVERFPGQTDTPSFFEDWLKDNFERIGSALFTRLEAQRYYLEPKG